MLGVEISFGNNGSPPGTSSYKLKNEKLARTLEFLVNQIAARSEKVRAQYPPKTFHTDLQMRKNWMSLLPHTHTHTHPDYLS